MAATRELIVVDTENGSRFLCADPALSSRLNAFVPDPASALQPHFVVDPAGNDNNAGTPEAPVRTLTEVIRRLGAFYSPRIHQVITLRGPIHEPIHWWLDVSHALLEIEAELSAPLYTGLLTHVANRDPANQIYNECGASWVVDEQTGRLLFHEATGRTAWIAKDLENTHARLSPWWRAPVDVGNANVGDVITTRVGTQISGLNLFVCGGFLEGGTTGLILRDLDFTDPGDGKRSTIVVFGNVIFERCKFTHLPQLNGGQIQVRGCYIPPDDVTSINYFLANLAPVDIVFAACLSRLRLELGTSTSGSVIACSFGTLVQGSNGNGIDIHSGFLRIVDLAIADSALNGLELKFGGDAAKCGGPLVGTGNGGFGFRGFSRTTLTFNDPGLAAVRITGSAGDFSLDGTSSAYGYDPVSGDRTELRTTTWDHLRASIATGGFGTRLLSFANGAFIGAN